MSAHLPSLCTLESVDMRVKYTEIQWGGGGETIKEFYLSNSYFYFNEKSFNV